MGKQEENWRNERNLYNRLPKGEVIPGLNSLINHHAMKTDGGVEV
jgi:hypothetical protein